MKILVIRFSSIGDIVLTSPVLRCLHTQLNAEVHFFTKENFKSILEHNPYVSKTHLLKKDIQENIQELKAEKFDYIIDLHHNLRSLRIKKALNVPSFSFNKLNIQKWLLVQFHWNKMPNMHIVDRYMDCCKSLGVKNDEAGLDYFISEKDHVNISSLPVELQNGYIALAIGAQHATKRMPLHKLIELCKSLPYKVLILGGKEDVKIAEKLVDSDPEKIFSACGKYNLNQSASLIKQSMMVISHDTGLMHIAAAFKKKIISIWGNTLPDLGMYPYKTIHYNAEVPNLKCRPCSKIGFDACPKKHFHCMELQNIQVISSKAAEFIQ